MNRYEEAFEKVKNKLRGSIAPAAAADIIPYKSENGKWIESPYDGNSWWTGGFWPGLMWQLYAQSGEEIFRTEARRVQELLAEQFRVFDELNHDVGFMYLLSCGADAKLTGDAQAATDTLHAASLLMGRFNPTGFIRAWNHPDHVGFAIIDCMMNLSLLFRASRETGDPRFAKVARIHADTTLREFLREDGSVSHIIEFDPETGKRVREHPGQGYALGSQLEPGPGLGPVRIHPGVPEYEGGAVSGGGGEDRREFHRPYPAGRADGFRLLPAGGGGADRQPGGGHRGLRPDGAGEGHRKSRLAGGRRKAGGRAAGSLLRLVGKPAAAS